MHHEQFGKSALLFVAIGLLIYAGLSYRDRASTVCATGTAIRSLISPPPGQRDYDWVILGASHVMPLDFGDFNALMQRDTGLRIINLAAQGTGPLYYRFAFRVFSARASHAQSTLRGRLFAFYLARLEPGSLHDAKLIRGMPLSLTLAWTLGDYVRRDGALSARAARLSQRLFQDQHRDRSPVRCLGRRSAVRRVYRPLGDGGGPAHRVPLSGCHTGRARALSQAVAHDPNRVRTRTPRDRRQAAGIERSFVGQLLTEQRRHRQLDGDHADAVFARDFDQVGKLLEITRARVRYCGIRIEVCDALVDRRRRRAIDAVELRFALPGIALEAIAIVDLGKTAEIVEQARGSTPSRD